MDQVRLSPREKAILGYIARGYIYKEIALELGIAYQSVKNQAANSFVKLEVGNKTSAAVKAVKLGIIELPEVGEFR